MYTGLEIADYGLEFHNFRLNLYYVSMFLSLKCPILRRRILENVRDYIIKAVQIRCFVCSVLNVIYKFASSRCTSSFWTHLVHIILN